MTVDETWQPPTAAGPQRALELSAGSRVAGYLLLEELARGGQGVLFKAQHEALGTLVALKLTHSRDLKVVKRFQQEAQVLARLSHSNLPRVTDLGLVDGRAYMAMELIEGEDLRRLVGKRGVPAFDWTAEVLTAVAKALEYCHSHGVLHRDVKPANILIEAGTHRPVLVDFGLARRDADRMPLSQLDGSRMSASGETKGTPSYMAPEQANADFGEVGPRTDVYALGATLYHLLTASPPFTGDTTYNVIVKVMKEAPPDPRRTTAQVPDPLASLCRRAMAKDPADRPESAAAFVAELSGMQLGGPARPLPPPGPDRRILYALLVFLVIGAGVGVHALWPKQAVDEGESISTEETEQPRKEQPAKTDRTPPHWYGMLREGRRPPLPLPEQLEFGEKTGEYINTKDRSVLVWVPPGRFQMGRTVQPGELGRSAWNHEMPVHTVILSGYFIGRYEVTWAQYRAYCRADNRPIPLATIEGEEAGADHPVFNVTWDQSLAYCRWAGLDLPTEAEWEYAARGPEGWRYPSQNQLPSSTPKDGVLRANVGRWTKPWTSGKDECDDRDGFRFTSPVGHYGRPGQSPFGCADMAGNVWEWVWDRQGRYTKETQRDPRGPAVGSDRGTRGGSFRVVAERCSATYRGTDKPSDKFDQSGFRVCFRPPK